MLFAVLLLAAKVQAQVQEPRWVVLDKNNQVGVVKPGANDILIYMAGTMKTMDKNAFDELNGRISFTPGSAVLIMGKAGSDYMATDIEGRTLVVKGSITPAEKKEGSGVGYIKENITADGIDLKQGMYVWIKGKKSQNAIVQHTGNKTLEIPADMVYMMDETTAEMAAGIPFKKVE